MSTAYLLRLESDSKVQPSPYTLSKVATVLGVPYEELMRLAGYLIPAGPRKRQLDPSTEALFADLDDADLEHVTRYIRWYREEKKRSAIAQADVREEKHGRKRR